MHSIQDYLFLTKAICYWFKGKKKKKITAFIQKQTCPIFDLLFQSTVPLPYLVNCIKYLFCSIMTRQAFNISVICSGNHKDCIHTFAMLCSAFRCVVLRKPISQSKDVHEPFLATRCSTAQKALQRNCIHDEWHCKCTTCKNRCVAICYGSTSIAAKHKCEWTLRLWFMEVDLQLSTKH